ncbi:MAG: DUF5723 family protein [Bacteroidia bacterium]
MRLRVLFLLSFIWAQDFMSVMSTNYAGSMGAVLQPASIVDGRYMFDMTLLGLGLNVTNNYVGIKPEYIRQGFPSDTGDFRRRWLVDDYQSTDYKKVRFHQVFWLPSFMMPTGRRSAMAVNFRIRTAFSVSDVDYRLAKLVYEVLDYAPYWRQRIQSGNLNLQYLTFIEVPITYAREIFNLPQHYLKAGATLRPTFGVYSAYAYTDNATFRYQFYNDDTLAIEPGSRFFYGHSANVEKDFVEKFIDNPFNRQSRFGVGFDFGFVYEFRPNISRYTYDMDGQVGLLRKDREKHALRIGASLLNVGGNMSFAKGPVSNALEINPNNLNNTLHEWNLRPVKLSSVKSFNDTLRKRFGIADSNASFKLKMPTYLSLQADLHIVGPLSVGGFWMTPLRENNFTVRGIRMLQVHPRFETPYFAVGVPFTSTDMKERMWGVSLKVGPFIAGSANFFSLFFGNTPLKTLDFYFALKFGLPYKVPKDRDRDKVSDKKDLCPTVPGVLEFAGCPDSDGDHVADKDDECPLDPGLPQFRGCPDTDSDGIPDKEDSCPTESGLVQFKGCPDTDSDGIPDKEDKCPDRKGLAKFEGCPDSDGDDIPDDEDECPTQPGLLAFRGCPDRDNDGIPDKDDQCPDQAGLAQFQGCPDTDGDGIPDKEDECPTQYGPAEFKGCPDTDKDGLADNVDKCPTQAGPIENKGCPYADQDGDGVLDKDDDCPFTPGSKANKGCPELPKEEQEILNLVFKNLEFDFGKATIRPSSYPSLDELANLLLRKPSYRLRIDGHTDNVGKREYNIRLSQNRANAVKQYLIGKGIEEERIEARGFGPDRPIASNKTEAGRAKNRRVEFKVLFE